MARSESDSTDIWMPLYIGDYMASTSRLTTEQHGAYLLLRMDYWKNGPLPDDDRVLAQITRLSPDAWSMHRAVLEKYFIVSNGQWQHEKLNAELADAREKRKKARAKAEAAARARWGRNEKRECSEHSVSTAQADHEQCPSPSPSPSEEKEVPPSAGDESPSLPSSYSLWDLGVKVIGGSEKASRAFLGKQVREFGEREVRQALVETVNKQPADPKSYLMGVLKAKRDEVSEAIDSSDRSWAAGLDDGRSRLTESENRRRVREALMDVNDRSWAEGL